MREHTDISLKALSGLFGMTRQAFYKAGKHQEDRLLEREVILAEVDGIRSEMPKIGTRKLHFLLEEPLKAHGIFIGRDRLNELLSKTGRLVRKRRRKPKTTDSRHRFKKWPNLIKGLEVLEPNKLWVADITYIRLPEGFCYLSLLTDAYSRLILGYRLCGGLGAEGPLSALETGLKAQDPPEGMIHHSDRGTQYCSDDYVGMLISGRARISMTQSGDPKENAIAERVNGVFKDEFGLEATFANFEEAERVLEAAVRIYNGKRPHASLDYLTPEQAHKGKGQLKKRWKNYYKDRNGQATGTRLPSEKTSQKAYTGLERDNLSQD